MPMIGQGTVKSLAAPSKLKLSRHRIGSGRYKESFRVELKLTLVHREWVTLRWKRGFWKIYIFEKCPG